MIATTRLDRLAGAALAALAMIVTASLTAGCGGGSGSSGFSIVTEREVMAEVLTTGECVERSGVTYCPADSMDALGDGRSLLTPFVDPVVLDCFVSLLDPEFCEFVFTFIAEGFGSGEDFATATRAFDTDDAWNVSQNAHILSSGDDTNATGRGLVDPDDGSHQLAIVVLDGAVGDGDAVEDLRDTGTELVFVLPEQASPAIPSAPPGEQDEIDAVLADGNCRLSGPTLLCPSNTFLSADTVEPSLGIIPFAFDTQVTVALDESCAFDGATGGCSLMVDAQTQGLFAGAYRLAVRIDDGSGEGVWRLGETAFADGLSFDPVSFEPSLSLFLSADLPPEVVAGLSGAPLSVQTAVLVEPIPGFAGETIARLEESVAIYAFVTASQNVTVSGL